MMPASTKASFVRSHHRIGITIHKTKAKQSEGVSVIILHDYRDGQQFNAITLRRDFEPTDILCDVGGTAYLGQLVTAVVGSINARDYLPLRQTGEP